MQILSSIDELAAVPGPVHVAIGFFDGVHAGHQAVIAQSRARAEEDGGTAVVATFDPHPLKFLRPAEAPRLLTSTRHKELILERLGVSHLLVIPFDAAMAALGPEEFVGRMAEAGRPLASITVGRDWAFGRGRAGNLTTLQGLGEKLGFEARGVAPVTTAEGEAVSSTRIRAAVERGDFTEAAGLLARDYSVLGTIVHGRHLGNQIGFPTANLALEAEQLPPQGVYAVRALVQGTLYDGVANLGYRPTVDNDTSERHLEVHVFDFSGDLYGETMEVRFVQRLREERKFDGLEALKEQIGRDVEKAREVFAGVEGAQTDS